MAAEEENGLGSGEGGQCLMVFVAFMYWACIGVVPGGEVRWCVVVV